MPIWPQGLRIHVHGLIQAGRETSSFRVGTRTVSTDGATL